MELRFELMHVAPGSKLTLRAEVKAAMAAKRLLMPNEFIPYFDVDDIRYNGESLFASPVSVPAIAFSESQYTTGFVGDDLEVGGVVEIDVHNHAREIKPIWATISDNYENVLRVVTEDE
jgi:hypothetical protein